MNEFLDLLTNFRKRIEALENFSQIKNLLMPADGKFVPPKRASAPASPVSGETYYDTTLNKTRTWDGSAWQNHW
jgi:hypothetical protein